MYMADVLVSLICLLIFVGLAIMIYRYRKQILRFTKDPEFGKDWKPSRTTILKRRIEDAEAEISYIEKRDTADNQTEID